MLPFAPSARSQTLGSPSLKSMSRRACGRYIRNMVSIGDMPVSLVQTLINKIDNAEQLRNLEINSPQVIGHTKEAWINLLKRDVPNFERRMPDPVHWRDTVFTDETAERWHKVYSKLKKAQEKEAQEDAARFTAQINASRAEREESQVQWAKRKAPTTQRTAKSFGAARYDMNRDLFASRQGKSGSDFFGKLQRNAVSKNTARLRTPNNLLKPTMLGGVKKVSSDMVENAREQAERERRERASRVEREKLAKQMEERKEMRSAARANGPAPPLHHQPQPSHRAEQDQMSEREARLRNLKTGQANNIPSKPSRQEVQQLTQNFLESDDDDDDGANDGGAGYTSDHAKDDDLFGVPRQKPARSRSPLPNKRPAPSTKRPSPTLNPTTTKSVSQATTAKARSDGPPVLKKAKTASMFTRR